MDRSDGRHIPALVIGLIVMIALQLLLPDPPSEWRHTFGMVLIVIAMGPWMLLHQRPRAYLGFAASGIAIVAGIEIVMASALP